MRIDDPALEHPRVFKITTAEGLSSNIISCITEDLYGRLYVGTGRGLDRLNPGGVIEHFSAADGLQQSPPMVAFRDKQGALWFGSLQGLSRWLPEPPRRNPPPPILIRGVRVRGVPQPMSELGERAVQPFSLLSSQNQMQFDFVSIGFRPAERPRYQYMLEGAGDADWRTTEARSVNYASLPPGSYRFLVRAVDSAGTFSPAPAIASFTILPPFWQRWWFRLLALLTGAAALYSAYRVRLRGMTEKVKLRYEERLDERTRIARELHDTLLQSLAGVSLQLDGVAKEIGPSSETAAAQVRVVRQQVDASFREARQKVQDLRSPMLHGRELSEVLRESLEQIVGNSARLQMTVAGPPRFLREQIDETVLRIAQEAVANAARHAQASEIQVVLTFEDHSLRLLIQDNGQGFNLDEARTLVGHWGLRNIQERAQRIGAQLRITTAPGRGTEIETIVPLAADR